MIERAEISCSLQENQPVGAEGAVLTGWIVVAEWMDVDGDKILTKSSSDAAGQPLATWSENGFLFEALHTPWPTLGEVDDEDET